MTHDRRPAGMGSLAPNQLLILNGVNTNLISRSLHYVSTNFLVLRCVMMEKGPMYGNLKYKQLSLRATLLRGIGGEVIVKKFSNNILDNTRRERILLNIVMRLKVSK